MSDTGHFRCYTPKRFSDDVRDMIGQANDILADYRRRGYVLTLRQLYYQFVARGLFANDQRNYSKLGSAISDGRLAGLVDWEAIEDHTRNLQGLETYEDPTAVLAAARASYRRDLWATQEWRPEVWIEKDALTGVVAGICNRLRVDFFACRGYNSQSEQWRAGMRFAEYVRKGQRPIVFHIGDHDPSGMDMTRDNQDRLTLFAGVPVLVVRLALNMSQIEELNPPPNPAKVTDSRFAAYQAEYGDESWELDALPPEYIEKLIADNVAKVRDEAAWSDALAAETADKDRLDRIIEEFKE